MNRNEEGLIVISAIVAILVSKIADFILPLTDKYEFFGIPQIDVWFGLIANIIILIVAAFGFVKITMFLHHWMFIRK